MANKFYLVTGASSGIGYQISLDLLNSGLKVLGVSRSPNLKIQQLISDFPDKFFYEKLDLTENLDNLSSWVLKKSNQLGCFSGFVHSAGIQQIQPLQANSYKHILDIFNLNVFSALLLAKGVSDRRVISNEGGSIVFLSSIASKIGQSGLVNYSSSKSALNGAMRSMAKELAPRKIRVNSVLPGFVMTEMVEKWNDVYNKDYIDHLNETYPLGIGEVSDISNIVCYLLSEKSKWISGSEFNINGGALLSGQE